MRRSVLWVTIGVPLIVSVLLWEGIIIQTKARAQTTKIQADMDILAKVSLAADELPNFEAAVLGKPRIMQTGLAEKPEAATISQTFRRRGEEEDDGKHPTTIRIDITTAPDAELAYQLSLAARDSSSGGLPRGSLTGLPIGEACWTSPPKTRQGAAKLVVLDGRNVVVASIMYRGVPWPSRFSLSETYVQIVSQEDQQSAEGAVRLILARYARYNLLGQKGAPPADLLVRGQRVNAQNVGGIVVSPAKELLERLGIKPRLNQQLLTVSGRYKQREVVIAVGAREILVGNRKVKLPCPVMLDGDQPIVPVEALMKALAIKTQREKKSGTLKVG